MRTEQLNMNTYIIRPACLTLLLVNAIAQATPRVAIVGGGVGGAFTATRIMELSHLEHQPEVDV